MKKKRSSQALIRNFKKSLLKKFSLSLIEIQKFRQFKYILIIKSISDKNIRISLYPLEKKGVIKLTIIKSDVFEDLFYKLSEFLKKYDVIHSSGLIKLKNDFKFECFIQMDLESSETYDLRKFLDNIKNSNTLFSIEKIKFKR